MMVRRAFLSTLLIFCLGSCQKRTTVSGEAPKGLRIAVIPKGTTHEFWKAVHAGAIKAGRELGAEIVWKGPLKEDDLKAQVELVQSFTAQGVSGIVLAPLNDKALVAPVKNAVATGVPVVIFDSDLKSPDPISFVATDNRAAGRLAGERMAQLLGQKGNVALLRYQEGSASTHQREEGFLEALRAHPGIHSVSNNQYAGPTTESAFSASENLLLAQSAAKGNIDGIFCPNESTTFGMLLALEKAGLAGKVRFVGFDASEKLVQAVRTGHLHGLVLQNPFQMGYLGVKTLIHQLNKQQVDSRIDTGSILADSNNLESPEISALLKPDLKSWLGEGL